MPRTNVVEASKYGREYGIITPTVLGELFDRRMIVADLLSRSSEETEAFAARQVLLTLDSLKTQLESLVS